MFWAGQAVAQTWQIYDEYSRSAYQRRVGLLWVAAGGYLFAGERAIYAGPRAARNAIVATMANAYTIAAASATVKVAKLIPPVSDIAFAIAIRLPSVSTARYRTTAIRRIIISTVIFATSACSRRLAICRASVAVWSIQSHAIV